MFELRSANRDFEIKSLSSDVKIWNHRVNYLIHNSKERLKIE